LTFSAVVFAVFTKYFSEFADLRIHSSCAKRNDVPAMIAVKSCELYALGFRSERAKTTAFHAFGELEFLALLSMYDVNYCFEHVINVALSRPEIQMGFPLL